MSEKTVVGQCVVSLANIDTDVYTNYRKSVSEGHIANLQSQLKMNRNGEQLQNVIGSFQTASQRFALIAGYCRIESMRRNALADLIGEYNKEMGLSPGDPNFIPVGGSAFASHEARKKLLAAGEDWAARYNEALANYPVKIDLRDQDMPQSAAKIINMLENVHREDPPLWDLCARISDLLDDEVPGKLIAESLSKSAGAISQMKKIKEFPAFFRDKITQAVAAGELDAETAAVADTAIGVFVERCGQISKFTTSIGISHAREFTGAVMHKTDAIALKPAIKLLYLLTGVGEGGKFDDKEPPTEYTIFMQRIRQAKVDSQFSTGKVAPISTPFEPMQAPGLDLSNVAGVADVAAVQQSVASPSAMLADAEAAIQESRESLAAPVAEPVSTGNVPPGIDAAAQAEIAKANAAAVAAGEAVSPGIEAPGEDEVLPTEEELAKMEMSSTDTTLTADALTDDELGAVDEVDLASAGQLRTGTVSAPETQWKVKSAEKIHGQGVALVKAASSEYDANNTVIDAVASSLAAVTCFEIIGDKQLDDLNESYAVLIEAANIWLASVLDELKKSNAEAHAKLVGEMPSYIAPSVS